MKYTELIEEADKQVIKQFFLDNQESLPSWDYYSIIGFLYGLAMTPEENRTDEWMDYILGDKVDEETSGEVSESLLRIFDNHISAFSENHLRFPFNLSHMIENNRSMEPLVCWANGLLDAFYFRSSFWDGEAFSKLDGKRQQLLYHSMLMIEGIIDPQVVREVFEKLPLQVLSQAYPTLDLNSDIADRQIVMICITSCQEAVDVLQQYARDIGQMQKMISADAKKKAGEIIKVNFADKVKKE